MMNDPLPLRTRKLFISTQQSSRFAILIFSILTLTLLFPKAVAAEGTATIEGRVLDIAAGRYLARAQVYLEDTNLRTQTNETGYYRIENLPAGEVILHVTYTGFSTVTRTIRVDPATSMRVDFQLSPIGLEDGTDPVLFELDELVVTGTREFSAQAIAVHEQRYAQDMRNVVAADEFGQIAEGNFGEFLKYLPGVAVNYSGTEIASITLRGVPAEHTILTVDGSPATRAGLDRAAALDQFVMNDVARVEVVKSVTPDQPANAMGGTINIVRRTALEYPRPSLHFKTYATFNTLNPDFGRKAGPTSQTSGLRTRPSGDFMYANPVSESFGFTISGLYTTRYIASQFRMPQWAPVAIDSQAGTEENPALINVRYPMNPAINTRWSGTFSSDWKVNERNLLKFAISHSNASNYNQQVDYRWQVGTNPVSWSATHTQGRPGAGDVRFTTTGGHVSSPRYDSTLEWQHFGTQWMLTSSAYFSYNQFKRRDLDKGLFASTVTLIRQLTIEFDDIGYEGPGTRIARDTAGNVIDATDSRMAVIADVTSNQVDARSILYGGKVEGRRPLHTAIPATLSIGAQWTLDDRNNETDYHLYQFVGPTGVRLHPENTIGNFGLETDAFSRQAMPWGLDPITWYGNDKLVSLFRSNPEFFNPVPQNKVRQDALTAYEIQEVITAGFARIDAFMLNDRLQIVGGLRYEHTYNDGRGPRDDVTATYQRDSEGNILRDAQGRPLIVPGTPEALALLRYTALGERAKRDYDGIYPSINASYDIWENLKLRVAYARTIGRPNFIEILPGITISEPTALQPQILVRNPDLNPWKAHNFDLTLEYYPATGGIISIGAFQRNFSDFFGRLTERATPEFLESIGLLDDIYLDYDVVRRINVGSAQIRGFEYNFRYSLAALHSWFRGMGVYLNGTELSVSGERRADFRGFTPRTINWGIWHRGRKHNVQLNWNYTGFKQDQLIEGGQRPADTFLSTRSWLQLGISSRYNLTDHISVYLAARNILNAHKFIDQASPNTPHYARLYQEANLGAFYNFGIEGRF